MEHLLKISLKNLFKENENITLVINHKFGILSHKTGDRICKHIPFEAPCRQYTGITDQPKHPRSQEHLLHDLQFFKKINTWKQTLAIIMHVNFQSYPRQPIPVKTQLQLHIPPFQVHYLLHFYDLFHPANWLSVIEFMKPCIKHGSTLIYNFAQTQKPSVLSCKHDQYGVRTSASKWMSRTGYGQVENGLDKKMYKASDTPIFGRVQIWVE